MTHSRQFLLAVLPVAVLCCGCADLKSRMADIRPPDRPSQLSAYDSFVGSWEWEAKVVGLEDDPEGQWTGTATWAWTLDKRFLRATMSARNNNSSFDAAGFWSWHPTKKKYVWWMFSNWGYPQEGTAHYDSSAQRWVMPYTSVGLDGTTSYGRYEMVVAGPDRLEWRMSEWADPLHLVKKSEMVGAYQRTR